MCLTFPIAQPCHRIPGLVPFHIDARKASLLRLLYWECYGEGVYGIVGGRFLCFDFFSARVIVDRFSSFRGRDRDQFDFFAQALRSTLPNKADTSTEEGFKSLEESAGERESTKGSDTTENAEEQVKATINQEPHLVEKKGIQREVSLIKSQKQRWQD